MSTPVGNDATHVRAVHAYPTKDFFVKMITRDIALEDCIFDLLDNSIDGARRKMNRTLPASLAGFFVRIHFNKNEFRIEDNCGGILLSDAIDYAFNFGRRLGSPSEVEGGIGLYGIGMKRAIFKMGRAATVSSEGADACFEVKIDVDKWEAQEQSDWDFDYDDATATGVKGTKVTVTKLYPEIASLFSDEVFKNELSMTIARDYAFFIDQGLEVAVDGTRIPAFKYHLRESDTLRPAVKEYEDDGVSVRILAGLIDDLSDEIPDEMRPGDVDRFGWFVGCNDRVVLAGDKTNRTVWGDNGFPIWHGQYNGFAGFALFRAADQRKLPWTTTKRGLDNSNPVYRRAVAAMKEITLEFIAYTNRRKADLDAAREAEKAPRVVDIGALKTTQALKLPELSAPGESSKNDNLVVISYRRKKRELDEIRRHLGKLWMSNKDIGMHTFTYFVETEMPK